MDERLDYYHRWKDRESKRIVFFIYAIMASDFYVIVNMFNTSSYNENAAVLFML